MKRLTQARIDERNTWQGREARQLSLLTSVASALVACLRLYNLEKCMQHISRPMDSRVRFSVIFEQRMTLDKYVQFMYNICLSTNDREAVRCSIRRDAILGGSSNCKANEKSCRSRLTGMPKFYQRLHFGGTRISRNDN